MHVPGVIASYRADDCSHDYRYFRQLQEISDTVVEPTWEGHVAAAVSGKQDQLRELEGKINTEKARLRYLDNLVRVENGEGAVGEGVNSEEDRTCILCKCEFTRGYITPW